MRNDLSAWLYPSHRHVVLDMRVSVEKSGLSVLFSIFGERTARCYISLLIMNCVLRFERLVMNECERLRKKLEEQGLKKETIDRILDWYSVA
jgi:hypothetical protein